MSVFTPSPSKPRSKAAAEQKTILIAVKNTLNTYMQQFLEQAEKYFETTQLRLLNPFFHTYSAIFKILMHNKVLNCFISDNNYKNKNN